MNVFIITEELIHRLISVVDKGLVAGTVGEPKPGKMCVEAAVCYVLNEPHSDNPSCVASVLRDAKIALNDFYTVNNSCKLTNKDRGRVLKRLAVLQLGTKGLITKRQFKTIYRRKVIEHLIENYKELEGIYEKSVKFDKINTTYYTDFDFQYHNVERDVLSFIALKNYKIHGDTRRYKRPDYKILKGSIETVCKLVEDTLIELKVPAVEYLHLLD